MNSWAQRTPEGWKPGTIRADFADSIDANAVHGSDAAETAQAEVAFFLPSLNIYSLRCLTLPCRTRLGGEFPCHGGCCTGLRWVRHHGTNLLEFDLDGLAAFCERLGKSAFAPQLFRWIWRGASDFDAMVTWPGLARQAQRLCAGRALPVISEHVSSDGTVKWLFDVGDGNAVEAVMFIPRMIARTLCVIPGWLRRRLPFLLDGSSGFQSQSDDG